MEDKKANPIEALAFMKERHQVACANIINLSNQIRQFEAAKKRFPGNGQVIKMLKRLRLQYAGELAVKNNIEGKLKEIARSMKEAMD